MVPLFDSSQNDKRLRFYFYWAFLQASLASAQMPPGVSNLNRREFDALMSHFDHIVSALKSLEIIAEEALDVELLQKARLEIAEATARKESILLLKTICWNE